MVNMRDLLNAICEMLFQFLAIFPVREKKIVFDNFGGRGYGCDPKYIAEELLKRNESLDLVWLTKDIKCELPEGIRPVRYGSIRAMYELATAKVWIDNIKNAIRLPKKRNQYYIQTWHSSLGLKRNEQDAEFLKKTYVRRAKRDAAVTDLMYSNNAFRAEKYKERFWYHGEVIRCGHPRNTILLYEPQGLRKKVEVYCDIDERKKFLLYAPTFRNKEDLEVYLFNVSKCLEALGKRFGGEYICLLRLHPNAAAYANKMKWGESVYNVTGYPDMQELMAVSDVLITDYSGSMFEFMLTGRPIFLFMKDLKRYIAQERKLYFSFEELPFLMAESESELCNNILQFNQEVYKKKCKFFMNRIDMRDDGNGAEQIADIILNQINNT